MKLISPVLGGIVGGAQLSTADLLMFPSLAIDVGLSGSISSHFLWAVPLGALIGNAGCWALAGGWKRDQTRREFWRGLSRAIVGAFIVAPIAPGMLGLSATPTQMKQGLAVLSFVSWLCFLVIALFERRAMK